MRDTYIMQDQSSKILKHNIVSLIALFKFDYPIYFKPRKLFFRKLAWPISIRQSTYAEVVAQCLICFKLELFFLNPKERVKFIHKLHVYAWIGTQVGLF